MVVGFSFLTVSIFLKTSLLFKCSIHGIHQQNQISVASCQAIICEKIVQHLCHKGDDILNSSSEFFSSFPMKSSYLLILLSLVLPLKCVLFSFADLRFCILTTSVHVCLQSESCFQVYCIVVKTWLLHIVHVVHFF